MADAITVLAPAQGRLGFNLGTLIDFARYNPQLSRIVDTVMSNESWRGVVSVSPRDVYISGVNAARQFIAERRGAIPVGIGAASAGAVALTAGEILLGSSVTAVVGSVGIAPVLGALAVAGGAGYAVGSAFEWGVDKVVVALSGQSAGAWACDAYDFLLPTVDTKVAVSVPSEEEKQTAMYQEAWSKMYGVPMHAGD